MWPSWRRHLTFTPKPGDHKLLMGVEFVGAPEADSSFTEMRGRGAGVGGGRNPPEAAELLSL